MNLEQATKILREHFEKEVAQFNKHFQNGIDGNGYPSELSEDDWFDQFTAFQELDDKGI
jgi:hypothetical protein